MKDGFKLHENFKNKVLIREMEFCTLLKEPNSEFNWFILVPRVQNVKNILGLSKEQKLLLWEEIDEISNMVQNEFSPDQINIAMFGNITPQLHVHIIARYETDSRWPNSVF